MIYTNGYRAGLKLQYPFYIIHLIISLSRIKILSMIWVFPKLYLSILTDNKTMLLLRLYCWKYKIIMLQKNFIFQSWIKTDLCWFELFLLLNISVLIFRAGKFTLFLEISWKYSVFSGPTIFIWCNWNFFSLKNWRLLSICLLRPSENTFSN